MSSRPSAVSSDGTLLVKGDEYGRVYFWHDDAGRVPCDGICDPENPREAHAGVVLAVAISLDGEFAATGGWDRTIILWDAKDGIPLRFFNLGSPVYELGFSIDDTQLKAVGKSGVSKVWDIAMGKKVK